MSRRLLRLDADNLAADVQDDGRVMLWRDDQPQIGIVLTIEEAHYLHDIALPTLIEAHAKVTEPGPGREVEASPAMRRGSSRGVIRQGWRL